VGVVGGKGGEEGDKGMVEGDEGVEGTVMIIRAHFNDGTVCDFDFVEFGKDEAGAVMDRLAIKHGGVKAIYVKGGMVMDPQGD
jgi:hypothetical protein